ncbi:DNA polymerase III subunit alpha, partial [Candidatus Berkelbacteria bacterium]|nr:DNA polymerase III subunit alpha [Candidatus Berkelbacteria bacterium]
PMELIPDYIAGKHGKRKTTYLHPKLEPILRETYGIAVYQEQVLRIARDIAGFSLGEADVLRKAIGKKIRKLLLEQRKKFIDSAVTHGVKKEIAEKLFEFTEPFARYGFNKSHAASYALIAYWTAYFKANYPDAFMAALLSSEASKYKVEKLGPVVAEAQVLGLEVLPPDVNESLASFSLGGKSKVRYGLAAIKNVGDKAAHIIVAERLAHGAFRTLADFVSRLPQDTVNKKIIESLAAAGALDSLGERAAMLGSIEKILQFAGKKSYMKGQGDLFGGTVTSTLELNDVGAATAEQKLAWEKEYLGCFLTRNPFKASREHGSLSLAEIGFANVGDEVAVTGVVSAVKPITTKNGAAMAFVRLEDETHHVELVVFPSLWRERGGLFVPQKILTISGTYDVKDGDPKILVNTVVAANHAKPTLLTLILRNGTAKEKLEELKSILQNQAGNVPVEISIETSGEPKRLRIKQRVAPSDELLHQLRKLIGENNVRFEM